MQRLAGEQALVAGVPVVELDELGVIQLEVISSRFMVCSARRAVSQAKR
jgi:hypothetical protein